MPNVIIGLTGSPTSQSKFAVESGTSLSIALPDELDDDFFATAARDADLIKDILLSQKSNSD